MKKFFTLIAAMVASSSMMAQEWTGNLFGNPDVEGADMSWFAVKNNTPGGTEDPEIKTGETLTAVEGKGVNGSKAIEIVSYALTDVDGDHNNAWQAQFWIVLPKKPDGSALEVSDKIKVSFDCRAESDYFTSDDAPLDGLISIDTQAHGTPGNYHHYQCIGQPTFGQEWSTYEAEAQVAGDWLGSDGQGFQTIAFNLSAVANYDVRYYIDNIVVQYEKVDEAQVVYWKPIVTNGDFEGDNTTNYVVRIYQQGDKAGIDALEKKLLAQNAEHKDWACTEEMMKLTRDGKALYLHCLPADITGLSCKEGEVDNSVFDRYIVPLYKEASYKPYIIAAMIFMAQVKDPVKALMKLDAADDQRKKF